MRMGAVLTLLLPVDVCHLGQSRVDSGVLGLLIRVNERPPRTDREQKGPGEGTPRQISVNYQAGNQDRRVRLRKGYRFLDPLSP